MLRRVVAAIALIALASLPVAARTRLVCRYSGVEIRDCPQDRVPGTSEIQVEGCCDRHTTQPPGVLRIVQQQESFPPVLVALPGAPAFAQPASPAPIRVAETAAPVFLITRALLI